MGRATGVTTLAIGVIAGASFLLSIHFSGSLLLPFVPFLVLGLTGFAYGFDTTALATLIASLIILTFSAGEGVLAFLLLFGIPSMMFIFLAMRTPDYPIGKVVAWLTLYAALLVMNSAIITSSMDGGLEGIVQGYLKKMLPAVDPSMAPQIEERFQLYPYVFLAIPVNYLVLACYAVMYLAHYLVVLGGGTTRSKVGIAPFNPPLWLPLMLLICGLLSFSSGTQMVFAGKALFLILLLPYFLSGLSLLHHASRNWAGRFWILLLLYLSIGISVWISAGVVAFAVVDHARSLGRPEGKN